MKRLTIEDVLGCTEFEFTDEYGVTDDNGWIGVYDGHLSKETLDPLSRRLRGTLSETDYKRLRTMGGATVFERPSGKVEVKLFGTSDAAYAYYNTVITNEIDSEPADSLRT